MAANHAVTDLMILDAEVSESHEVILVSWLIFNLNERMVRIGPFDGRWTLLSRQLLTLVADHGRALLLCAPGEAHLLQVLGGFYWCVSGGGGKGYLFC